MAATVVGRLLTQQHRQQQLAVRARALQMLIALWPLFDVRRIDETWLAMEPALLAAVERGRAESAALSSAYYRALRAAEGIEGAVEVPALEALNMAQVQTSLRVTGPVVAKQLVEMGRADAASRALVTLSGAMTRHVLQGGRATVLGAAEADTKATGRKVGWARVTSADPCYFCAMLASRGPVYTRESSDFKAHDACACTAEPMWRDSRSSWPPRSREWRDLYNESTRDAPSGELLQAFRRAYEGRKGRAAA